MVINKKVKINFKTIKKKSQMYSRAFIVKFISKADTKSNLQNIHQYFHV
jgi:hypothetical protein